MKYDSLVYRMHYLTLIDLFISLVTFTYHLIHHQTKVRQRHVNGPDWNRLGPKTADFVNGIAPMSISSGPQLVAATEPNRRNSEPHTQITHTLYILQTCGS